MRGDAQPILTGFHCRGLHWFVSVPLFLFFFSPTGWTKTPPADKTDRENNKFVWLWCGGGVRNLQESAGVRKFLRKWSMWGILFTFRINLCPDSALYVEMSLFTKAGNRLVQTQGCCSFNYQIWIQLAGPILNWHCTRSPMWWTHMAGHPLNSITTRTLWFG